VDVVDAAPAPVASALAGAVPVHDIDGQPLVRFDPLVPSHLHEPFAHRRHDDSPPRDIRQLL